MPRLGRPYLDQCALTVKGVLTMCVVTPAHPPVFEQIHFRLRLKFVRSGLIQDFREEWTPHDLADRLGPEQESAKMRFRLCKLFGFVIVERADIERCDAH